MICLRTSGELVAELRFKPGISQLAVSLLGAMRLLSLASLAFPHPMWDEE